MLIGGVQRDEQIKNQIEDLVRRRIIAIDLIDNHDRLGTRFEGFAEHKPRLSLRTICGIDDQKNAVDHVHDAFDFAAKIGMPRRINDVDVVIVVFERSVLGLDGDTLFALQVHGVHDPFFRRLGLIGAERPGLFQQTIHQRGLAMINMGDNCNVSDMLHRSQPSRVMCLVCEKGQVIGAQLARSYNAIPGRQDWGG